MSALEPAIARVNQMRPRSGQPKRFSFPHRDQRVNDAGYAEEYDQPQAQSYYCKFGFDALYLSLDGFGESSGFTFGGVLPGSWACGVSRAVVPGTRFMILVPGGGSLFEMTSSPLGPL